MGKIISMVENEGFKISNIKMTRFKANEASDVLHDKIHATPFVQDYIQYLVSDVSVGLEVIKDCGIDDLKVLLGPENALTAKNVAPQSVRALFGKDNMRNAVHSSDSPEHAYYESSYFFNTGKYSGAKTLNCQASAILNNCSLLLIKPHIMQ